MSRTEAHFQWSVEPFCYSGRKDGSDGGKEVEAEGGLQNLASLTWESTKYRSEKHSHNKVSDQ